MGVTFAWEALRKNWYLLLVLLVLVIVIAGKMATRSSEPAEPRMTPAAARSGAVPPPSLSANGTKRLTPSERALETIQQHQADLQADPKSEMAPSLLLSIGNLYMQKLQDYPQAIESYERIIVEHPQWDAIQKAYVQLGIAYEKSGNVEKARSVYTEMMKRFAQDSVEYQYAQRQLGEL